MNIVKHIKEILGILVIVGGFSVWAINYHDKFVTRSEKSLTDLDTNISNARILVTIYELHGVSKLNDEQTRIYKSAVTQLTDLKTFRITLTTTSKQNGNKTN